MQVHQGSEERPFASCIAVSRGLPTSPLAVGHAAEGMEACCPASIASGRRERTAREPAVIQRHATGPRRAVGKGSRACQVGGEGSSAVCGCGFWLPSPLLAVASKDSGPRALLPTEIHTRLGPLRAWVNRCATPPSNTTRAKTCQKVNPGPDVLGRCRAGVASPSLPSGEDADVAADAGCGWRLSRDGCQPRA